MKASKVTRETIRSLGEYDRGFIKFAVGDTIAVSLKVKEGNKERIQVFEGDVIAIHRNGASSTFMVRRMGADSITVERVFPYYSKSIDSIKFVRHGQVRRAKLYYLRDRIGKRGRVKEKVMTKEEKARHAKKLEGSSKGGV